MSKTLNYSSAWFTNFSYLSHKVYFQTLNEEQLAPSPVHQRKARKHQFLVSSIVLIPETLPCNTSGKRTFVFQNLHNQFSKFLFFNACIQKNLLFRGVVNIILTKNVVRVVIS